MPSPNCEPWAITLPVRPPTIAPRTCPAIAPSLELLSLCRLRRAVPQDHVAQLVRHHAGDLTVGLRGLEHPAVQEHRAARQRERVDLPQIHDFEGVAELRMLEFGGIADTRRLPMSSTNCSVASSFRQRQLLTHFGGGLQAELDVLLRRVTVLVRLDTCLRGGRKRHRRHKRRRNEPGQRMSAWQQSSHG